MKSNKREKKKKQGTARKIEKKEGKKNTKKKLGLPGKVKKKKRKKKEGAKHLRRQTE